MVALGRVRRAREGQQFAQGRGRRTQLNAACRRQQGGTDLGNDAYHGPCPDKGQPPHHYKFTIYALSVEKLDVPAEASGAMVTSTAKESALGKAVFIARYGR
jgi:phosphatidylethanolamine-binding protein (PEBP) family uncharacterized protein